MYLCRYYDIPTYNLEKQGNNRVTKLGEFSPIPMCSDCKLRIAGFLKTEITLILWLLTFSAVIF
jgi:hypothetical protein